MANFGEKALMAKTLDTIWEVDDARPRRSGRRKPRRWVVERTLAWLRKCRGIRGRYNKNTANDSGLLQLACALIWRHRY